MTAFSDILAEARDDRLLLVVAIVAMAILFVRLWAPKERRRLLGIVLFLMSFLALVPVAGALRPDDVLAPLPSPYREMRFVTLIFAAMSVIGAVSVVLFDVLLPRIRLRAPRILRDLVGGLATLIAVFAIASRFFDLAGIVATSAVATAAIGLSLQDTLGNVLGGLAIQLDNSIGVGDWIKVQNPEGKINGRVTEIRWRYTAIETRNWETLIVPNSVLMKGPVLVLGRRADKPHQWRRWVWFNVDYRYPPTEVIALVEDAIKAAPIGHVSADPPPNCILMDFGDSYGKYAARYWLTDLAADDPTDSVIRTRIYFALRRAGIPLSIPAHAVFMTEDSHERRSDKAQRERSRRLRALAHVDLFGRLSEEDRVQLADALKYAPFARGEMLTKQGAEAHWLYMLDEGEVSVRVEAGGAEREVARLRGGSFFGEMSLMTGAPRSATIVALGDVECYRLDKSAFQAILRKRPEVAEQIAVILAQRRIGLDAAKEGLSEETKRRRVHEEASNLLDSIRDFFGLVEEPAARA